MSPTGSDQAPSRAVWSRPARGDEPTQLTEYDFLGDRRQRLVRQAVEVEAISIGRTAEILGVPLREMREIAGSWV